MNIKKGTVLNLNYNHILLLKTQFFLLKNQNNKATCKSVACIKI